MSTDPGWTDDDGEFGGRPEPPGFSPVEGPGVEFDPDSGLSETYSEETREVLARVAAFAASSPSFAESWQANIQRGADQACAEIAGKRMAGVTEGSSGMAEMYVPVPDSGFTPEEVFAAFGLELLTEVRRRMEMMTPGSFG